MIVPPSTASAVRGFLLICAAVLAFGTGVRPAMAANPATGTLTPSGPTAPFTGSWAGTATGSDAPDEASCTEGVTCDTFRLTVSPGDYSGKSLSIVISWTATSHNYDLYLHKAPPGSTNDQANATTPIARSVTAGLGTREAVVIDPTVFGAGGSASVERRGVGLQEALGQ